MTNTREITIQGGVFTIPNRYAEGHVLTAGEANALNQTLAENVRNNTASDIRKRKEEIAKEQGIVVDDVTLSESDISKFQEMITKYANEYEFGIRVAREPLDPVEAKALRLITEAVRAKLKSLGQKATPEAITAYINRVREVKPEVFEVYRKEAKKQIDAARKAAAQLNEMLDA